MPDDSPHKPPRKKPSVLWWLFGAFLVLAILFFYQLFGPNPPIIVSPQTTYITAPLRPDGLPDYVAYWLERQRDGVTPENNAAVLLWQAVWPDDLSAQHHELIATELGVDELPLQEEMLQTLYSVENRRRVVAWTLERDRAAGVKTASEHAIEQIMDEAPWGTWSPEAYSLWEAAERVIDATMSHPWTSADIPPMAEWIADNEQPLNLLVEASARQRFYAPSAVSLLGEDDSLFAVSLESIQSAREVACVLSARAMWHLGEGRHKEAWRDLLAVHRWARLVALGGMLVDNLVAIAIDGIAYSGTQALISDDRLPPELARQIMADLNALPPSNMADTYDVGERICGLHLIVRSATEGAGYIFLSSGIEDDDSRTPIDALSVDWNIVLRECNHWYDRLAAAARAPDRVARQSAFARITADLNQLDSDTRRPGQLLGAALNRPKRSRLIGTRVVSLLLPAVQAVTSLEDRSGTELQLTRLAAALAAYRAEQGQYPDKLDDLVPDVLDALPVDLYHGQPFIYRRTDDGYLLYSTGENGRDDGGSHAPWEIFEGRRLDDPNLDDAERDNLRQQIPADADDISIRVPRPKFELPNATPAADAP